jgi:hypothetical protein
MTLTALPEFLSQAVEQLRSLLAQVEGVVNVRDGDPVTRDWATFAAAFRLDDGTVQGWLCYPGLTDERSAAREDRITLRCIVRGFRVVDLDGGSREAFRATVARVWDALRLTTLNGVVEFVDPLRSRLGDGVLVEDRLVGDVLCHVAELDVVGTAWLTF